ncbi:MAG: (Fe-S)-binding protein [Desulfamplus sp.]|nr:(Fe-S)-binding protein [Desulfamplus sp.]
MRTVIGILKNSLNLSPSDNFPAISREILTRKLDDVENTGADLLVTECPGCVMQLRGGALNQNRKFKVIHLAELLTGE